jgi:RNA polymerase sigma-70 factor, ECF subfamily
MDERARAIETIYRARYANFRKGVATISGSWQRAHDAVQEAFAEALAQRASFRGASLEAWIWRVALRIASRDKASGVAITNGYAVDPAVVEPERDPELAEALRRLPPRRRLIVFLRYFGDLSYADIAEVCDISEGTVAATLAHAREELEVALREGVT